MHIIHDHYKILIPKYKLRRYQSVGDDSNFIMLLSNFTTAKYNLDQIIRHPKLFNCINDDLNYNQKYETENRAIIALLEEFYLTLFPNQSQFEYTNSAGHGFRYMNEHRMWLENKKSWTHLITFILANICFIYWFCCNKFECLNKK